MSEIMKISEDDTDLVLHLAASLFLTQTPASAAAEVEALTYKVFQGWNC